MRLRSSASLGTTARSSLRDGQRFIQTRTLLTPGGCGTQKKLRVPGDAGEVAFAVFPLGTRQNARRDFDQAGRQLEDGKRRPRLAGTRVETTLIQRVGHSRVRQVLNDHLGEAI